MYYIVLLKNNGSVTPDEAVIGHREYLQDMVAKGKVLGAGRLDNNDGLVIYKVETEEEFKELLNLDPFVSKRYRDVESFQWNITIGNVE